MTKSKYHLRYLPIAVEDLTAIFEWIATDSPNRAAAFIKKIDTRIGKLEAFPFSGSIPCNKKLKNFGYRVVILDHYLVFYIIRGQIIEIHRVVHVARLLEDLI